MKKLLLCFSVLAIACTSYATSFGDKSVNLPVGHYKCHSRDSGYEPYDSDLLITAIPSAARTNMLKFVWSYPGYLDAKSEGTGLFTQNFIGVAYTYDDSKEHSKGVEILKYDPKNRTLHGDYTAIDSKNNEGEEICSEVKTPSSKS